MTWPAPCKQLKKLEWNLRYAPEEADLVYAASVVAAYQEILYMTAEDRRLVIREVKKGPNIGAYRVNLGNQVKDNEKDDS
jgi:hypothetical protein